MHKMERKLILSPLLLACLLLLAASQYYNCTPIMVQAIESVDFVHGPARSSSGSGRGYILDTQEKNRKIQGAKIYKVPSGPNPVGNRHPPSKS